MTILENLSRCGAVMVAATALAAVVGCGREAGPGAARKPAAAAAAAAASGTALAGAVEAESENENEKTARREGATDSAGEQVKGGGVLTRATAGQLLAAIRTSGKKATLVNAWASWCGPCRRELPMLQALSVNLKPQGVEVVLVSVDQPKDEGKALSFLKDNAIMLRSYVVEGDIGDFKAGIDANWPGMLPASFLFDRTASLKHFWGGEAFENELVPIVESFLAGRPIEAETHYGLAPGKVEP